MTKPEDFILTTDYATLTNDAIGSLQVSVPSSVSIPGSGTYQQTDVITLGTQGAAIRSVIVSSKDPSIVIPVASLSLNRTGSVSGNPSAGYEVLAVVYRLNSTQVALTAFIKNPYATTLTGASGIETIDATVRTFLVLAY